MEGLKCCWYSVFLVSVRMFVLRRLTTVECTVTWHELGSVCYGLSSIGSTYNKSQETCESLDSRIVQVLTYEVHTFLGSIMNDNMDYWVGLTLHGSNFTWHDGSTPDTDMWVPLEPNFTGERVRYTRKLKYTSTFINSSIHQLADNSENETYSFICMKQIVKPELEARGMKTLNNYVDLYEEIDGTRRKSSVHCAAHCTSLDICNLIGYKKMDKDCRTYRWTGNNVTSKALDGYVYYIINRPC